MKLIPDLREFLELLISENGHYLVVGGGLTTVRLHRDLGE